MTNSLAAARTKADNDVADAEQEAQEAAALVTALEERVRDGDDTVTPEQIASARELSNFARLRADATARKATEAKRTARLAACEELRSEIDDYQADNGDQAVKLLDTAYAALVAYITHVQDHNDLIRSWRERMTQLKVPQHSSPTIPPAEHANLGQGHHSAVVAGSTEYRPLTPWPALDHIITAARQHDRRGPNTEAVAAQELAKAKKNAVGIAPRTIAPAGRVHYRTPGGVVFSYNPQEAPSPEDVQRLGLEPLTEEEAYQS
ncbi:hypothetical protein [Streptomyces cinereoruber]|uniref:hypothetical protein n=1 Tax=Streptomyces cinereoruber TaxID=67260 RepID=UPI0033935812